MSTKQWCVHRSKTCSQTNTSHILIRNISCQDINPKSTCNIQVFFVFQGCVEVDLNILTLDGNLPEEMTNNKQYQISHFQLYL
jgi:hypothetical protein